MTHPRQLTSLHPEQLRRVREVWAMAQPRASEVHRAYRRWGALGREPSRRRTRPTWLLVVATCFVGGGAFAVTGSLQRTARTSDAAAPCASVFAKTNVAPMQVRLNSNRPVPEPEASADALAEISPPPPASQKNSARVAQRSAPPAVATEASDDLGSWSKVASAMRQGDELRVGKALEELSQSSDDATRDAARLARAQLDIAAGHPERARATLGELSSSGATPLIRHRASKMLQHLPE